MEASALPTQSCPQEKPIFNGSECIACEDGTYYDLKTLSCFEPVFVSSTDSLTKLGNVYQSGDHTVSSVADSNKASTIPSKSCPEDKPMFNGTECIACENGTYYDL